MKYNSKLIRQRNNFEETMRTESTLHRLSNHQSDALDYARIHAKFSRLMDHEAQHGPVRVIMRDGKLVTS